MILDVSLKTFELKEVLLLNMTNKKKSRQDKYYSHWYSCRITSLALIGL